MIRPASDPPAISFDGIPRVAHEAIRQAPERWNRWLAFCDAIQAEDFEMTCEEAAEMFSMVATLAALGVPFATDFLARVDAMRQATMNHPYLSRSGASST